MASQEGGERGMTIIQGSTRGFPASFPGEPIHKETPIHNKTVPVADKSGAPRVET